MMQTTGWVMLLLGLSMFCSNTAAAAQWHDQCRQTVLDYAYFRDRPDADGVAGLFSANGTFQIGTEVFTGREAIRQRVAATRGGPVFRHMMSTIRIEATGPDTARGVSYATVYSAPAGELPRPAGDFLALGEYHDRFVREGSACLIAAREFVSVMVPQ